MNVFCCFLRRPWSALITGCFVVILSLSAVFFAASPVHALPNDYPFPNENDYPLSTPSSNPLRITSGPDGNLWFTEPDAQKIGRITLSGAVTEYPLAPDSEPEDITTGPDGNLWFTETVGNAIGRLNPKTGAITTFAIPFANSQPYGIASGFDNSLWFVETRTNVLGNITTAGNITQYSITTANSDPVFIAAGASGVWFTEKAANKIARLTMEQVCRRDCFFQPHLQEYAIPAPDGGPVDITLGADGNAWFTEPSDNKIGSLTPAGVFTQYQVPTANSSPLGIAANAQGIAFTEDASSSSKIGWFPYGGTISERSLKIAKSDPFDITFGPDGNPWFTAYVSNYIGYLYPPGQVP